MPGKDGVELVHVCESLKATATRERELRALDEAMLELGAKRGTVVTRSDEGSEQTAAGEISIQPAWRWLLSREATSTPTRARPPIFLFSLVLRGVSSHNLAHGQNP